MPSGSHRARGLTWWGLLVLLAVSGAAAAALGRQWSTALQREREAELRFRGEQIRQAIARYHGVRQPAQWPQTLDDLLHDRRGSLDDAPRHHLRRAWTDPFTGRADWELLPAPPPASGFAGVRSRSDAPRLALAGAGAAEGQPPRVSDWRFVHAAAPPPERPASNPTRTRETRGGNR